MQLKKNKKPVKPVFKPYMKGSVVDSTTFKGAVMFFFSLFLVVVANVLLGAVSLWDAQWINIVFNAALLLVIYSVFFQNGGGKGEAAVNQGELMLQRQEAGRAVNAKDKAACYHPLKGLVTGLLGSLPVMICAVMLGVTAQLQYTGLGTLPSWISALQRQPEMGAALAMYEGAAYLEMEDILRLIVRLFMMPWVNMVGISNREGLLLLERLSVLVVSLPAVSYGLGYMQGVKLRSRVHTDIAMGKRKRAQKEKKNRRARITASKGPEQLN